MTVLGSAGSHPGPGRACSSYLLEAAGARVLLDCGNGSMANLLKVCRPQDLDAVVITHRHLDHWADLAGLYVALRYQEVPGTVPVYAHPGMQTVLAALGDYEGFFEQCPLRPVEAGGRVWVGGLALSFHEARHSVPALAVRAAAGGSVVAYSGDSAPSDGLIEAARDADLFIADCTWSDAAGPYPEGLHMTGRQAGEVAALAGARRILVTHVWPGTDRHVVAAEVAAAFAGEVVVAEDGQVVQL